ncbi:MAG: T9SS type A sorting domain-containing protein, partial [Ignavibacteriaceae bacterium]|nr:T9SS type A sorting domain-containing protein [Ignavibacteriaceae bacterium]
RYSLPSPLEGEGQGVRSVRLVVYDVLGREVANLVNEQQPPGNYEVIFDAKSTTNGKQLASGVYIYKITAGAISAAKKFVLIK